MSLFPKLFPAMIDAVDAIIKQNSESVTELDQAIGDGDHVTNLQRGIKALKAKEGEISALDWADALQNIGMVSMSAIGGASGSLYGTLFIAMSKAAKGQELSVSTFAEAFAQGVEAVKRRGKADAGEKTMLDVYMPVADCLKQAEANSTALPEILKQVCATANQGMESTRDMVATKGRASFLGERTRGHIDAGAKTAQLMICAIVSVLPK
ncbi:dihydroxyacetone kinase subunit DhaL [Methylotuvimicrobium buryatense]|uniref:Dihydroxyacetone kinase subunit L n=1 Tax=Methylotuvimicrobium buryatense TaxID=95641 RepID=A0A4P9USN8_METBY|nr:dihydroxyacetone kinase subunit DhaL [Methylotuvimicrobium buryatense]QCW84544.1 dihydroxyacetone kinase subunit L [Methylotuvimicrobium buryatense]